MAACSDGKLRCFEMQFGSKVAEISGMGMPLIAVEACGFPRFATISEQCPVVEVWDVDECRVIMTLTGAKYPVTRLLIHPRVSPCFHCNRQPPPWLCRLGFHYACCCAAVQQA